MSRILDKLISFLLLSLLFISPLLFSRFVYEAFLLPKACFVFLLIALILPLFAIRLIKQGIEYTLPVDVCLLGLLLAIAISGFSAQDKPLFFFSLSFGLAGYAVYFISQNLISTPRQIRFFLGGLFVSATILAIIGLAQYLIYRGLVQRFPYFPIPYRLPDLRLYGNRVYSTYGQPNNLGLYLSMGLVAGLYFLLEFKPFSRWGKWGFTTGMLLLAGLLFFVLDASGGLGIYCGLAGIGSYLCLGRVYLGREWFSAGKLKIGLFILAILLIFSFSQVTLSDTSSLQRTARSLQNVTGRATHSRSIANRLVYWQSALEIFRRSPLWGVGLGQFGLNYPHGLASLISRTDSEFLKRNAYPAVYAHNEFLQFLAETGILGLAFFGLIWFMVFKSILKTLSAKPSSLLVLTGSLFIPFLIQSLFSAPFRRLSLIVTFAFLLGIWVKQIPAYKRKHHTVSPSLGWLVMPLTLLCSLTIILGIYDNWRAGELVYKALRSNDETRLIQPEIIEEMGVNPYFKFDLTEIVAQNTLKLGVKYRYRQEVESAYNLYHQVLAWLPTPKDYRRMAIACFYLGKQQEGVKYLIQGINYVPWNKHLLQMLVNYYQYHGPAEQLQHWLRELEKYHPNSPVPSFASISEKEISQ